VSGSAYNCFVWRCDRLSWLSL